MKTTLFYVRLGLLCSVAAVPSFASSDDESWLKGVQALYGDPGAGDKDNLNDESKKIVFLTSQLKQELTSTRMQKASLDEQLEKVREESAISRLYKSAEEPSDFEGIIAEGERYLRKWTEADHFVQMLCAKSYMIVSSACESEPFQAEEGMDKYSCYLTRANTLAQSAVDVAPSVSMSDLKFAARVAKLVDDPHGFLKVVKRMFNAQLPLPDVSFLLDGIDAAKTIGQDDTALEFVKKILASYQDHPKMTPQDWLTCMRVAFMSNDFVSVVHANHFFAKLVNQTPTRRSPHGSVAANLTLISLINLGDYAQAAAMHDFIMRAMDEIHMEHLECGAHLYFKAGMYDKASGLCDEMMARSDKNAGDVKVVMDMFKKLGKEDFVHKTRYDLKAKNAHRKWVEMTKSVPKTASVAPVPSQRRAGDLDTYVRTMTASLSQAYLNDAKALLEEMSRVTGPQQSQFKVDFFSAYRSLLGCQKALVEGQAFVPSVSTSSASSSSSSSSGASSSSGPSASPLAQMGKYVAQMKDLLKQLKETKEERRRQAYERVRADMAHGPLEVPHGAPAERTPNVRSLILRSNDMPQSFPEAVFEQEVSSSVAASSVQETAPPLVTLPMGSLLKGTARDVFGQIMAGAGHLAVRKAQLVTLVAALAETDLFETAKIEGGKGSHTKVTLWRKGLAKDARPKPVIVAKHTKVKGYTMDALKELFMQNGLND